MIEFFYNLGIIRSFLTKTRNLDIRKDQII